MPWATRWLKAVSCCGWKADRAPAPRRAHPVSAGSSAAARTSVARATSAPGQGRRVRCRAAGWCWPAPPMPAWTRQNPRCHATRRWPAGHGRANPARARPDRAWRVAVPPAARPQVASPVPGCRRRAGPPAVHWRGTAPPALATQCRRWHHRPAAHHAHNADHPTGARPLSNGPARATAIGTNVGRSAGGSKGAARRASRQAHAAGSATRQLCARAPRMPSPPRATSDRRAAIIPAEQR